jgi:SAM-dependent methyltransferase
MASTITAAAELQRELWGTHPRAWAELAESHNRPLFEALLDAAAVGEATRLLDVGCGSGLALLIASDRGATVAGVDITPGLLAVARERLPQADLREADMEDLPYPESSFDVVIGVNSFQFAGDPVRALAQAARVVRPGGVVAASLFAAPERSQSTVVHDALAALSPPEAESDHAPYALSAPGNLEAALAAGGLEVQGAGEVACSWRYATMADAVQGLLCSAGGARAVRDAGEAAVREALVAAMSQFEDPANGVVNMDNVFRWVLACRPIAA